MMATVGWWNAPAHAIDEDAQLWNAISTTIDIGDRAVLFLEGHLRWTDDVSRLGQAVIRIGGGIKLDKSTAVVGGYAFFHTKPVGPSTLDEHRLWQQLTYRVAGAGKGLIALLSFATGPPADESPVALLRWFPWVRFRLMKHCLEAPREPRLRAVPGFARR